VLSRATLNCLQDGVKANAVLAADSEDEGVRDLANDGLSSFLGKLASQVEALDSTGRRHAGCHMVDCLPVGLLPRWVASV
jgi:hypothetical protein